MKPEAEQHLHELQCRCNEFLDTRNHISLPVAELEGLIRVAWAANYACERVPAHPAIDGLQDALEKLI